MFHSCTSLMEMSTTAVSSDEKWPSYFYILCMKHFDNCSTVGCSFLMHRFGVFVAKLMEELVNAPQVSILLASNLPANNYTNNAYR